MQVIPFNPGGDGEEAAPQPKDSVSQDGVGAEDRPDGAGSGDDRSRAERLEQALLDALRANAANWARAERAERAERLLGDGASAPPADRG